MSVNDIDIKKHAEMAATLLIRAPILKVPQAMRAAEFTIEQSQNPTLQQRVRRIWKEKLSRQKETTMVEGDVLIHPNRSPVSDDYPCQHAYHFVGTVAVGHCSVRRGDPTS